MLKKNERKKKNHYETKKLWYIEQETLIIFMLKDLFVCEYVRVYCKDVPVRKLFLFSVVVCEWCECFTDLCGFVRGVILPCSPHL